MLAASEAPLISVLIPAYNHAQYVAETVRSVWQQRYPRLEIVLVDDGSRDGTLAVAQGLQARSPVAMKVIQQPNSGLTKTLNRALELAEGEYVALTASDDVYCERRFETQAVQFRTNPRLKVAIGNGRHWRPPAAGKKRVVTPGAIARLEQRDVSAILSALYLNEIHFATTACLYSRSFLQEIGGWDTNVTLDDWVLNMRIFRAIHSHDEYVYVDEDLFLHRIHGANSIANVKRLLAWGLEAADVYVPPELLSRSRANLHWSAGMRLLRQGKLGQAAKQFWISQRLHFAPEKYYDLIRKCLNL
jgi:alpha-1,3-rhamnosyltransferase